MESMITLSSDNEPTLVDQPPPEVPEGHTTWPAPPLSPTSSHPPPPELVVPLVPRAPIVPADLVDTQSKDYSSE